MFLGLKLLRLGPEGQYFIPFYTKLKSFYKQQTLNAYSMYSCKYKTEFLRIAKKSLSLKTKGKVDSNQQV